MIWPNWLLDLSVWIPALTTTSTLAIIGAILGPVYKAKVEKGVQHNFDKKIELLRSELRLDEEQRKAETQRTDVQITALRSGALSGMSSRHAHLDKRRLEAAERVWAAACKLSSLHSLTQFMSVLKVDKILDVAAGKDDEARKMQDFLEVIWESNDLENAKGMAYPIEERPFVPPIVWACFSVYRKVLYYPYAIVAVGRAGINSKSLNSTDELLSSVISALPHLKSYVESNGTSTFPYIIDKLQSKLLEEITSSLMGEEFDAKGIDQAAKIIASASTLFDPQQIAFDSSLIPKSVIK